MTKRQLIDEIRSMNSTAEPCFLARFADDELNDYLEHLRVARKPRLSGESRLYNHYFTCLPRSTHSPAAWGAAVAVAPPAAVRTCGDGEPGGYAANDWLGKPVGQTEEAQTPVEKTAVAAAGNEDSATLTAEPTESAEDVADGAPAADAWSAVVSGQAALATVGQDFLADSSGQPEVDEAEIPTDSEQSARGLLDAPQDDPVAADEAQAGQEQLEARTPLPVEEDKDDSWLF